MEAIPFALSVHHFISTVGADAGFAAIIGLAIMVLLFFAQARETRSLRDDAEDSAEQIQQLELRVGQLARSQADAPLPSQSTLTPANRAPAPPPLGFARAAPAAAAAGVVRARVASGASGGVPAAPAGVGAPALSAATKLISTPDRDQISITANGSAGAVSEPPAAGGATVAEPVGPPPATAAGGANGVPPAAPPRVPSPAAAPLPGQLPRRAPAAPPRRVAQPAPPRSNYRSGRVSRGFIAGLGVLGVVLVVVVLLIVTSNGGSSAPRTTASSASRTTASKTARRSKSAAAAALKASSITVAVLNGTSTNNLAKTISNRLGAVGYKPGNITNASDQTETATVVGYLPHERRAGLLVAKSLSLGPASVQPVDQSNLTVACPTSSTPCTAQVVVTVGSDLASTT